MRLERFYLIFPRADTPTSAMHEDQPRGLGSRIGNNLMIEQRAPVG